MGKEGTRLRPDVVLWCNLEEIVCFTELAVPWEHRVGEAYELKKANTHSCGEKLHSEAGVLG